MADIFVSYASEDRDRIRPLIEAFEAEGWSVWWDRELVAGPSFEAKIQQALDEAKCVVVAWSDSAIRSGWCRDEAQEGLEREILVPVRIDDVRPPLGFRSSQTASLIGWPQEQHELNSLLAGIRECVGNAIPPTPAVRPTETAVAVMAFRNMSNDPDQEFFSDGIAEDILNELAKTSRELIVRPPSSSFALKGESLSVATIGDRLGVTHVLEGSVRRAGDRVRVTAQLSEVGGDRAIWSDRYDRDLTDIFDVQDEITGKILAALHVHLAGRAGARKFAGTEGYDAFLRGQYHARRGEFRRASDWYERAVNLDPGNADLWAERARHLGYQMSLGLIPNTGSSRASRKEYFERALAIDPSHWALAHRAVYTFIEDRQYQRAIDQLVEVVGSNTNSWEAVMYLTFALGAVDRQCDGYYKAAKRFSLLTNQFDTEVQMLLDSGRLDEARDLLGSTSRFSTSTLAFCRARLAAIERDVATLETLVADGVKNVRRPHSYFAALVPYLRGDYESAREIISKDKRANGYQSYLSKHEIALIERDLDAAAMYYGKAVHATEPAAMFWHRDTCFLNQVFPEFVAFPPYQKILEDIGLDPKSTAKIRIPGLPF